MVGTKASRIIAKITILTGISVIFPVDFKQAGHIVDDVSVFLSLLLYDHPDLRLLGDARYYGQASPSRLPPNRDASSFPRASLLSNTILTRAYST